MNLPADQRPPHYEPSGPGYCYNYDNMKYNKLSSEDRDNTEGQLGRELRGEVLLGSRCPNGRVEVIATSPFLDDETPFPTLFWLTCPLLKYAVARLENGDFRQGLRERLEGDPDFAKALKGAEKDYFEERERWALEMGRRKAGVYFEGRRGIGGTVNGGMKCLHAHLAHFLAGHANPVGAEVASALSDDPLKVWQKNNCAGNCESFLKREGRQ